eukprot:s918_g12.t1
MSDTQLRHAIQNAIWGEIYLRPSHPVAPGEALTLQNFDFTNLAESASGASESVRDMRPQWIQDLHEIFVAQSFTEQAEEGPVMYILTWFLHGDRRERCAEPHTVRLGSASYDWRTDIIFPWRTELQRGTPAEFVVVRPQPPNQPWQAIAAHVLVIQALPSDLTALLLSTIMPGPGEHSVQHMACILPSRITPRDVHAIALPPRSRHLAATVRRGHHLFHEGQQIQICTGESLTITVAHFSDDGSADLAVLPAAADENEDASFFQQYSTDVIAPSVQQDDFEDDSLELMQQFVALSSLNPNASEFVPNSIDLPAWTQVIDDIYRLWSDHACTWEGEPRSAFFLTWFVAPGLGRSHCWRSKRVMLSSDFWNWKDQIGQAWRDELDPDSDFEFHLVSPQPTHLEDGIVGHVILVQYPLEEQSAVLVTVYDPAIHDGHHFKAVHVIQFQSCPIDVFIAAGYGGECGAVALCGLRIQGRVMSHTERIAFHDAVPCDIIVQRRGLPAGWQAPVMPQLPGTEGISMLQQKVVKHSSVSNSGVASANNMSPSQIISLADSLPDDTSAIDGLPLSLSKACGDLRVSLSDYVIVSVDTGTEATQTSLHPKASFASQAFRDGFAVKYGFKTPISELHRVAFFRDRWQLDVAAWYVASFQKQPTHLAIVLCVAYGPEGGVFFVRALPISCNVSSISVACSIQYGSLIRRNGNLASSEVDLADGDVLEFFAQSAPQGFCLQAHSNRVQLCLEACILTHDYRFLSGQDAHELLPHKEVVEAIGSSDAWSWSGLPLGLDIHPSTWEALHCQPDLCNQTVKRYELYVDGATTSTCSAWAVVAIAVTDKGDVFRGCLSGITEINPQSEQWIGAARHSNIDAELTAMAVATYFAHFCQGEYSVVIRPDLALSHHFSRCAASSKNGSALVHLVQALGQMAGPCIAVQEALPLATLTDGTKVCYGDCNVIVVQSEPRFMVVRVQVICGALDLYLVVAHAPCITADRPADQVSEWWRSFGQVLSAIPASSPMIGLIDANAPLAETECQYYGLVNAEPINAAGHIFQDFLQTHELYVPSTFSLHQGSGATWRHPRGQLLRRDYVVVNTCAFNTVVDSCVVSDFDGGFAHVDHWPSVVRFRGLLAHGHTHSRLRWDRAKFKDPACRAAFEAAVRTLPSPSWAVSVDDHARVLETNIVQVAQQCFGGTNKARQRPVLTEVTLNGIQLKRQILDMLRTPWGSEDPALLEELKTVENLSGLWFDVINSAGMKSGSLGSMRLMNVMIRRPFTVCQETWRDQFAEIEAGVLVDELQLQQLHVHPELPVERDLSFCPGPCEVMSIIRRFKNGKVPGPSGLPVDVLKAGGFAIAQLLAPLLVKSCWSVREPITWKGGLLVPLFKGKGSASDPTGYRSIFISDICAKVHHARIRDELATQWCKSNDLIQQGGRKGCSTDVAHHVLHAYTAWARTNTVSCGLLFVDLQSAFYSVMRSSLFDQEIHDDMLCQAMIALGIQPSEWIHIRDAAAADYAVEGVHPQIECILKDMFSATHFEMKGMPHVTATTRGTRPGDPVADVLFNMAFRLVVLDARSRFQAASDAVFVGDPSPADNVVCPPSMPSQGFAEVSFVDDIAYVLHSPSAADLVTSVQTVASCLHDAVHHRGLRLNYGSGKTEAMVRLVGPGSRKVKVKVWHELGGSLPVVTEHSVQQLRLVHSYKHLGSFMQDHAIINKDLQYRNSQARKAYGQLARPFYSKRSVHDHTKALVFSQLVLSRHTFNVHTWSWCTETNLHMWQNGVRDAVAGLARKRIRPIPAFQFSTGELCALLDLNSPLDLLYANCLRYVRKAIQKAPVVLWSLLWDTSSDVSWFSLLGKAFAWFQMHATRQCGVDSTDLAGSLQAIAINENWNGIVRGTLKSSLAFAKAGAEGKLWTRRFQAKYYSLSTLQPSVQSAERREWKCGQCAMSFVSKQALAVHARHKHDYMSTLKRYVFGDECLACGRKYFNRHRLLAHVKAVAACRDSYLSCFLPAPSDVVESAAAMDLQHATELRAQGWMPTKAFVPPVRVYGPYLPPCGSDGATDMRRRWAVRNGAEAGDVGLDGFNVEEIVDSVHAPDILPFLFQSYGGADSGKCGVFQRCDLAAEAARLHVTCYVFIHFYSGYRREGDLQHSIEYQATISQQHLFCISIDLCLAKQHSDLTSQETKSFWMAKMRSGQILGVGGGPSCETWSAARHNPGGPIPLRSYDHPWGLPGLRLRARVQVAVGTCLVQFLVDLLLLAAEIGLCGFLEHPAFPTWIIRARPASIWMLDPLRLLARCQCFQMCTFDPCIFGLPAKKPTTLALLRLDAFRDCVLQRGSSGRCNHPGGHAPLEGKRADGSFATAQAKIYPRAMNRSLALAVSLFLSERSMYSGCRSVPGDLQQVESYEFVCESTVQPDFHG